MLGVLFQLFYKRWAMSLTLMLMLGLLLISTTTALVALSAYDDYSADHIKGHWYHDVIYTGDLSEDELTFIKSYDKAQLTVQPYWQGLLESTSGDVGFVKLTEVYGEYKQIVNLKGMTGVMGLAESQALRLNTRLGELIKVYSHNQALTFHLSDVYDDHFYNEAFHVLNRAMISEPLAAPYDGYVIEVLYSLDQGQGVSDARSEFLTKFYTEFNHPLSTEILRHEVADYAVTGQVKMPIYFTMVLWLLECVVLVVLLALSIQLLIGKTPTYIIEKNGQLSVVMGVYMVFYALILGFAFVFSTLFLNVYIDHVFEGIDQLTPYMVGQKKMGAHLVSFGILLVMIMSVFIIVVSHHYGRLKKTSQQMNHRVFKSKSSSTVSSLLFIALINTLVLLLIMIQINGLPNTLKQFQTPELWGIPMGEVVVDAPDLKVNHLSYDMYDLVDTPGVESVLGVTLDHYENQNLPLTRGRMPLWPNEVVVGYGLFDKGYSLGSHLLLRTPDKQADYLVVGEVQSLFNRGQVVWMMNESQKGVTLDDNLLVESNAYRVHHSEKGMIPYIDKSIFNLMLMAGLMMMLVYFRLTSQIENNFMGIHVLGFRKISVFVFFSVFIFALTVFLLFVIDFVVYSPLITFVDYSPRAISFFSHFVLKWSYQKTLNWLVLLGFNLLCIYWIVFKKYLKIMP